MKKRKLLAVILSGVLLFPCFPIQPVTAESNDVDVWDGTLDTSWYDDEETEFHLSSASEFAGMATLSRQGKTFENCNVYLESDIDYNNSCSHIPLFKGNFFGNNHTLSNLKSQEGGLFGTVYNGTISGIRINNATIQATKQIKGEKITFTQSMGEHAKLQEDVTAHFGGICNDIHSGTIQDCSFEGTIKADYTYIFQYGGTSRSSKVKKTTAYLNGDQCLGGIVGYAEKSTISHCQSVAPYLDLRSEAKFDNDVIIVSNEWTGDSCAGGICGKLSDSVIRCCDSSSESISYGSVRKDTDYGKRSIGVICGYTIHSVITASTGLTNYYLTEEASESFITYCYHCGTHYGIVYTGDNNVFSHLYSSGPIVVFGSNTVTDAYILSGSADGNTGTGEVISKSDAAMKKQDFAERLGYPFVYVEGEYPKLAWELGEEMIMGDVNLGGKVSIADAVELKKALLAETVLNSKAAYLSDLDYNGIINSCDLTLLKRMLIYS